VDDGRVEVFAQGSDAELSRLRHVLREGPRFAYVIAVEEMDAALIKLKGFHIEP
jgi:acylphosphatase